MSNKASFPIIIGDVRFIMFDSVVRTFSSVLHVPSLNKNIISFGYLDKEGFRFIDEDGVFNVGS